MALLNSINRYAQEEIFRGMLKIYSEHDEKSRQNFFKMLGRLNGRDDLDIVITHFDERFAQPEFGLAWFGKDDALQHPLVHPQNALLIGGLVYDPYANCWGLHT